MLHDDAGVPNLGAFAYLNGYIQGQLWGRRGCETSLENFSPPPLEKCVGHGLKNLGPS